MSAGASAGTFAQLLFWTAIPVSTGIPLAALAVQLSGMEPDRSSVAIFAVLLAVLAATDVFHLRALSIEALQAPCLAHDLMFLTALSIALNILPAAIGAWALRSAWRFLMRRCGRAGSGGHRSSLDLRR